MNATGTTTANNAAGNGSPYITVTTGPPGRRREL